MAKARIPAAGLAICVFTLPLGIARVSLAQPAAPPAMDSFGGHSSNRVVVKLRPEAATRWGLRRAGSTADADVLAKAGPRVRTLATSWRASKMRRAFEAAFAHPAAAEKHGLDRTFVLEVPQGTDTVRLSQALRALSDEIETASPDAIGGIAADPLIPPDAQFSMQWAMHNIGQPVNVSPGGTVDADIDAPEAWAIHTGDGGGMVVVAVLDSGISSHPEYGNNLGVLSTGRVLPGWNTVVNNGASANLQDNCSTGHGTHVAGIIAAAGGTRCSGGTTQPGATCETVYDCTPACGGGANHGQPCVLHEDCPGGECGVPVCASAGVAGVSWGAYLLPVKVLTGCSGNSTDLTEGIIWAVDHGADIINISLQYNLTAGQQAAINALQAAVDYAHQQGVLVVSATGNNDFCSNGIAPPNDRVCYPARMPNVLAVTATDNNDLLGTFANYGAEVDVAAPGKDIRSTINNGSYGYLFGTSMAAPHVAGLAALIKSHVPSLTNDQIAEIILATAEDRGAEGWDMVYGFGRINAHQALLAAAAWPGISESNPPDGAIDAGHPAHRDTLEPLGWSNLEVRFPRDVGTVASTDFSIEQTAAGAAPAITTVESLAPDLVRLVLDRPIEPLAWTTITHVATGSRIRLGYLPGDVEGNSFTGPSDILALIDSINGVAPRPAWSTDVDRSGTTAPADILAVVDLLNGATPFESYNGAALPPMP